MFSNKYSRIKLELKHYRIKRDIKGWAIEWIEGAKIVFNDSFSIKLYA